MRLLLVHKKGSQLRTETGIVAREACIEPCQIFSFRAMTRAGLLRHALSQALRRVHIGAKKLKIDEETRWQIAGEAVGELRRFTPSKGVAV